MEDLGFVVPGNQGDVKEKVKKKKRDSGWFFILGMFLCLTLGVLAVAENICDGPWVGIFILCQGFTNLLGFSDARRNIELDDENEELTELNKEYLKRWEEANNIAREAVTLNQRVIDEAMAEHGKVEALLDAVEFLGKKAKTQDLEIVTKKLATAYGYHIKGKELVKD